MDVSVVRQTPNAPANAPKIDKIIAALMRLFASGFFGASVAAAFRSPFSLCSLGETFRAEKFTFFPFPRVGIRITLLGTLVPTLIALRIRSIRMNRAVCAALLVAALPFSALLTSSAQKSEQAAKISLKVGDTAPEFTLLSDQWKTVKLSDFHGKKNVFLAVYVLAFTGG